MAENTGECTDFQQGWESVGNTSMGYATILKYYSHGFMGMDFIKMNRNCMENNVDSITQLKFIKIHYIQQF